MNGEKFGRTGYWEGRLTNGEQQGMVGHGFDAVVMCALCFGIVGAGDYVVVFVTQEKSLDLF